MDLLFHLICIHWLILVCALTRHQTHNLSVSGRCSNQLPNPGQGVTLTFDDVS